MAASSSSSGAETTERRNWLTSWRLLCDAVLPALWSHLEGELQRWLDDQYGDLSLIEALHRSIEALVRELLGQRYIPLSRALQQKLGDANYARLFLLEKVEEELRAEVNAKRTRLDELSSNSRVAQEKLDKLDAERQVLEDLLQRWQGEVMSRRGELADQKLGGKPTGKKNLKGNEWIDMHRRPWLLAKLYVDFNEQNRAKGDGSQGWDVTNVAQLMRNCATVFGGNSLLLRPVDALSRFRNEQLAHTTQMEVSSDNFDRGVKLMRQLLNTTELRQLDADDRHQRRFDQLLSERDQISESSYPEFAELIKQLEAEQRARLGAREAAFRDCAGQLLMAGDLGGKRELVAVEVGKLLGVGVCTAFPTSQRGELDADEVWTLLDQHDKHRRWASTLDGLEDQLRSFVGYVEDQFQMLRELRPLWADGFLIFAEHEQLVRRLLQSAALSALPPGQSVWILRLGNSYFANPGQCKMSVTRAENKAGRLDFTALAFDIKIFSDKPDALVARFVACPDAGDCIASSTLQLVRRSEAISLFSAGYSGSTPYSK